MEFKWIKTTGTWIRYSWWIKYSYSWNNLYDHFCGLFIAFIAIILQTLEFPLEIITRPFADIFKLGRYYNE